MTATSLRRVFRRAAVAIAASAALLLGAGTAQAADIQSITDDYLFHHSLSDFISIRDQAPYAGQLDWSSDGCSHVPNSPFGFRFLPACERHDFGYRNYKRQGRFTEPNRKLIDDNFRADMYHVCGGNWACRRTADIYYFGVRELGGSRVAIVDAA
ncbi:phospholipase [Solihabitans fulvus]|uniref:Phospholipase n=1 Tax=Solihabitans fulvus TaxID=1892852 RepID=A0A5B2X6T6_9PSEU|nr:phospholipase [Solihabitans fulvus]KAA2258622.1 phospholipase [Solihabitans fulvus]